MTAEVAEGVRLRKVTGGTCETEDGRFVVVKVASPGRYAPALGWWLVIDQRGAFAPRSVAGRNRVQRVIAEHLREEAGMGT